MKLSTKNSPAPPDQVARHSSRQGEKAFAPERENVDADRPMTPARKADDEECLVFLKALGDETRWRMVRLLTTGPESLTLTELADRLDVSAYNASRHTRILLEAGILRVRREGRFKHLSITPEFRHRLRDSPGPAVLDLGCCRFDFSDSRNRGTQPQFNNQLREKATVSKIPPMSDPARYIMIGGFLGAGKTTAIANLANHLVHRGKRVGLITNDQGRELVDTQMLRSRGFATEEIPGGCFCCKFNSLVDAAGRLTSEATPEIFVAEPVGSCTDLVATVTYPLRRIYGERFTIAPLSVLVDPMRARRILGLEEGRSFSEKVTYIYRKQLEEADLIVISKSDLLDEAGERELRAALEQEFPGKRVFTLSARTGAGLQDWFDLLESEDQVTAQAMEIDYDTYADGEALLGWLNATIELTVDDEVDSATLLDGLAEAIRTRLNEAEIEVAHLKMTLSPLNSLAGEVAVINLVRNESRAEFGQELEEPVNGGQIILNLRAEGDPERLESIVRESIEEMASPGLQLRLDHLERFRPGRPVPTHRDA